MSDSITCPECKTEIPLTEAISQDVAERLRADFEDERERLIAEQERQLAEKDAEREAAIAAARDEEAVAAAARAADEVSVEIRDLQSQIEEKEELRCESEKRELTLMADKRKLENERASLQLEVQRRLNEGRDEIAKEAIEQADERHRLQMRDKELQIQRMTKRIDDLQTIADQKPAGLQGEVLEREIEDVLDEEFPNDAVEPVKSGKLGADIVQRVRTGRGDCGTLLWESKRQKNWQPRWIEKLRSDQQREKADVGIIVSSVLPADVEHIDCVDGVWVCDFASVVPLALMLRQQLDKIAQTRIIDTNRSQVADEVYGYLCSQEVQHYITDFVVSALTQLQELNSERTSAERTFNKREKQIRAQLHSVAAFYGGLQGIAGGALQPIAALEMPPGDEPRALPLAS
jgi:hypothetical protein